MKGRLPPGIHESTWDEVRERFAYHPARRKLFEGFMRMADDLKRAGCRRVYLDGGFVTARQTPHDFDCCWETAGMNESLLPECLKGSSLEPPRLKQKDRYGGEGLPAHYRAEPGGLGLVYLDYFQRDRPSRSTLEGKPKGIIAINL
jgi:hypothetical protein